MTVHSFPLVFCPNSFLLPPGPDLLSYFTLQGDDDLSSQGNYLGSSSYGMILMLFAKTLIRSKVAVDFDKSTLHPSPPRAGGPLVVFSLGSLPHMSSTGGGRGQEKGLGSRAPSLPSSRPESAKSIVEGGEQAAATEGSLLHLDRHIWGNSQ